VPRVLEVVSTHGTIIRFPVESDYHPNVGNGGAFPVERADGGTTWVNFDNCLAVAAYEQANAEENGRPHLRAVPTEPEDVA
jgi:hypothetical protein